MQNMYISVLINFKLALQLIVFESIENYSSV